MTDPIQHLNRHMHRYRRVCQWLVLAVLVGVPLLNTSGIHAVAGTLYSFSIGQLTVMDPALVIQGILLTGQFAFPWLIAAAVPFLLAAFLGKVFCSWMCPFNLLGEFAQKIGEKCLPARTRVRFTNPPAYRYWVIFAGILVIMTILGVPLMTYLSMPGLISGQLSDWIVQNSVGIEIVLVGILLVLEVGTRSRFWCKYICPVGATLALAMHRRTLRVQYFPQKCQACRVRGSHKPCSNACPFHLDPRRADIYPYCMNCGECVVVCRQWGRALVLGFTSHGRTKIAVGESASKTERSKKEVNNE